MATLTNTIPEKTIERLSEYRRTLLASHRQGITHIFSHVLAGIHGITAVQVRRDLMLIGFSSDTKKGYDVQVLIEYISRILDSPSPMNIAVLGMGHLGQAITKYFNGKGLKLKITAAFDVDPEKVGKTIDGIPCYHMDSFEEVDEEDRSALNLRFPPAPRSGSYPVITSELGKAYGDHRVFSDVSITIGRGDKVAFVGRNGEGKSTMVKAIMGQIDFEGEIRIGHNVRIGYFAQNEASGLDESITVFKTVDDIAVGDIRTRIRDILGAFMFGKEASEKLVKVLSGGERTRLAMIKLLLEPVNLLILDEPTNHLDLKTKEILKEALMAFDGTLIVVSHDRDFLDGLTSKIYEFSHGRVTEHLDGVYGFLRKKKIENISEIERRKA